MPLELAPHVEWLVPNRGGALQAVLGAQGVHVDTRVALGVLVDADSSPGHHAVQWLCDTLIAGGMRWEDVAAGRTSKAGQTLDWFGQHRRALPGGHRNLEDHQSLASVYRWVAPHLEQDDVELASVEVRGRELRRLQRARAHAESIMVCQRPELIVAVPTTEFAAQWWGRGTRWCTAARQECMFAHYNAIAPLIVVMLDDGVPDPEPDNYAEVADNDPQPQPGRGKLQLYIDPRDGGVQFMDASDERVERAFIERHWAALGPLMLWVAGQSPQFLHYVPGQHRSWAVCMRAVQSNGDAVLHVPSGHLDAAMCNAAIDARASASALRHLPDHMRTPELSIRAVTNSGIALEFVPERYRTPEVYMAAVASMPSMLSKIPAHSRTALICTIAMQGGGKLRAVPDHLRTRAMLEAAVSGSGRNLRYIHVDSQDYALCTLAVVNDGKALQFVRHDLVDAPMVDLAVTGSGNAIRSVPAHLVSPQLYRKAVINGCELDYVPPEHITHELCMLAVAINGYAIKHVPTHMVDEAMSLAAVRQQPWVVCEGIVRMTPDVIRVAITHDSSLCDDINELDPVLVASCVHENGWLLNYIEPGDTTLELCLAAVSQCRDCIEVVPRQFREAVLQALPPLQSPANWQPEVALAGLATALAAGSASTVDRPGNSVPSMGISSLPTSGPG